MRYLVTACVLSERLKSRPKPGLLEFFERSELVVPFGTYLTIERGLNLIGKRDAVRERKLRSQFEGLLGGCEVLQGHDPEIARSMARMLGYGSIRHTWVPNEKAKEPAYGHYPWVAASSLVTGIPIAAVKMRDLEQIHAYFDLPGLYSPVKDEWIGRDWASVQMVETPILHGVSTSQVR